MTAAPIASLRSWTDENTGRQVSQIGEGLAVGYFRFPKHLPDGRILVHGSVPAAEQPGRRRGRLFAVDPHTGDAEVIEQPFLNYLRTRVSDGKTWFMAGKVYRHNIREVDGRTYGGRAFGEGHRELWEVTLPHGTPSLVCQVPDDLPGHPVDITCDGRFLILEHPINEAGAFPIPTEHDASAFLRYLTRRRRGFIYAYDTQARRVGRLVEMNHVSPSHSDPSPVDPTLVRYTEDVLECTGQRMFTVRTDGSEQRALRVQEFGEMITHEFWWADPNFVGYTYIDRRGDETIYTSPWCEYTTRPSHLGICDLRGHEVYRSDPLNSYHAHLYMSPDGGLVCGEGTAWNNFICAGEFSWRTTKLDLRPLATIHTPWVPTRGSGTNCAFSKDGQWLLYNDTVDGKRQMCRVRTD